MVNLFHSKTIPIVKKNKYINPYSLNSKRKIFHYLLWQAGFYNDDSPPASIPSHFTYPKPKSEKQNTPYSALWINHNSFLIHIDSIVIITDPIWSMRCSPISCIGPKRSHAPPLKLSELSRVDMVLISHNHYDHLDSYSVIELHRSFPNIMWILPKGVVSWFHRRGIQNTTELSWWECRSFHFPHSSITIEITAVPAQHFSGRGLLDHNKTLWCGFVATVFRGKEFERRLYFVGDTGYNERIFQEIGDSFYRMDLSLIPIGTYLPKRFMSPVHINPKQAVTIHNQVHSSLSIGMHWYTFRLSEEKRLQPAYDLLLAMQQANLDPLSFRAILPGDTIYW